MQRNRLFAIIVFGFAFGLSVGVARSAELPADDLREIEQLLAQLNFDPGAIDGAVDDRTRTAIRLYQEFAILPVDGEPSSRLLRELRQVSQVYAEMREAAPPPEPEAATPREPEAATLAGPDSEPVAAVAAVDPLPEAAPETPAPPSDMEAPAVETPAPEAPVAAADPAQPDIAETVEPGTVGPGTVESGTVAATLADASALASEMAEPPAPEPEPEPEPAVAISAEPEPEAEVIEPAEPEPAAAAPAEPQAEPVADPVAEPEAPAAAQQVAEAKAAAPELEMSVAKPLVDPPLPKPAPKSAAPEVASGFNISSMIARLKKRDETVAPAVSKKSADKTPTAAAKTIDRASYERTLIWNVQRELRRIGIDPGAADGNMRKRTAGAIQTYQRSRGLPADGRVSEALLARLQAEALPPEASAAAAQQPQDDAAPLESVEPQAVGIGMVPSNGYQAFGAGYGAARTGDYGAAVKLYDQAIQGGDLALEHLAAALYNRANAYQYLGVLDKAIEDYSAAIANKPVFPAAYYNRGFAFDTKGEQGRAVDDFRKARDLGLQRLGVHSPDLPPPLL